MKIPYFVPWITREDKQAVVRALNQRWLTNGPILKKFEEQFGKFIGSKYSVGISSATHGLHLILKSLDIGSGDEVIVPTMTFSSTADVVSYCGGKPILADVDNDSFNISSSEIKKRITKRTRAIIVVHYGGQSCDMDEIMSLARSRGLSVIEDCAHALGSTYKKFTCGNIGIAGCFSFYPTKVITTGEGGMITTNSKEIHAKTSVLRTHGMNTTPADREVTAKHRYDIIEMGYNYRLDEIRASLGLSQLSRINEINKRRINVAKKYNTEIQKINGLTIPKTYSDRNHIYHLYSIKVENDYPLTRDELFVKLSDNGIGTSVQYYPLHLMSYNKKKYDSKQFPNSNSLKDKILCLPIYPKMTTKSIDFVISCLKHSK